MNQTSEFSILLYLTSSFVQADAAIIALVGVFVIFKLQFLQSWTEEKYSSLLSKLDLDQEISPDSKEPLHMFESEEDRLAGLEIFVKDFKYGDEVTVIRMALRAISLLKSKVKRPLIIFSCHIVANALLLILANGVSRSGPLLAYSLASVSLLAFGYLVWSLYMLTTQILTKSAAQIVVGEALKQKAHKGKEAKD